MKTLEKNKNRKNNKKKVPENTVTTKRIKIAVSFALVIFVSLITRIGWIQFVQGAELKERASRQQTLNQIISPKRGNIYDVNKKVLATSADVDTITINPSKIAAKGDTKAETEEKTLALKEKVAKGLSDIFSLDYETVLAQVKSEASVETIVKKVEKNLVDELKEWMKENDITEGINIDEDTKRYYPYNNLAAHVIGFTGTDSQGLYGIEHKWDSTLKGTSGKIVTTVDRTGTQISDNAQQYIEVENGSDLYLTIDVNIQMMVEKYLEKGVTDNGATAGSAILMNPKTGEVLAMATYPSYNLNDPSTINNQEDLEKWDTYTAEEKADKRANMWADRNFSRAYEPGSTFKLILSAIALEEGITDTDVKNDFHCEGHIQVEDRKISCAESAVHGNQTLRDALRNSCNVAFIQLGSRIGKTTLYKYFDAFGLFERTGIAITGETRSNFHDINNLGPVELATTSFGQRFEITPLQLISAVSAIANDGTLVKPKIVKQIQNGMTGTITELDTEKTRNVISEQTAKKIRDMMKTVTEGRENIYGKVAGYEIGGKTGTSEPSPSHPEEGYAVSYLAIAPADEPEVIGLVVVYNPATKNPYGSRIAAPILSNILSEVLPYLGIASNESDVSNTTIATAKTSSMVDVTNKTLTEAKRTLENLGYKVVSADTENSNSVLVTEQVPAKNTQVLEGSTVILYTEENSVRTSVSVPNLIGLTLSEAKSALSDKNLNVSYSGSGKVVNQSTKEGEMIEQGSIITIKLE